MLLARAAVARDVLPAGLAKAGGRSTWSTPTAPGRSRSTSGGPALAEAEIVTFTSSSTVTNLLAAAGGHPAAGGGGHRPGHGGHRRDHGLAVDVEAEVHTIDGLVDALLAWAADHPSGP